MHIHMRSFWEDPRIKTSPIKSRKLLPSISKTSQIIWTPLSYPTIKNVRRLIPLDDPIISRLYLVSGKYANMLLSRDVYSSNATLFRADSYWIIKIFCEFDFANYPFDHQYCSLFHQVLSQTKTVCSCSNLQHHSDFG